MAKDDRLALAKSRLSPEELEAYTRYVEEGRPPLAQSVNGQLFNLYLNGKNCKEIAAINPNLSLGLIVRAKIEGFWDEKRESHLADLLEGVRERVQQTQLEAVVFASDLMSAIHKFNGEKLKKYLQTGNPDDLAGVEMNFNLKTYSTVVELLMKLTGQDKNNNKSEVLHKHTVEAPIPNAKAAGLTATQAARILEVLEADEGKK
jgi:hypothetical protein